MFRTCSFYKNHTVSLEKGAFLQKKWVCTHERLALGRSKSRSSQSGAFQISEAVTSCLDPIVLCGHLQGVEANCQFVSKVRRLSVSFDLELTFISHMCCPDKSTYYHFLCFALYPAWSLLCSWWKSYSHICVLDLIIEIFIFTDSLSLHYLKLIDSIISLPTPYKTLS